ncbi:hypothetical protein Y981_04295 [Leptospirillum ferriphilum YSK]|uniref:Uncharacterized protein n=1 Tax=Leptospirillum ferriphilum YSK TaxID=1441628 RepID=A0A059XSJ1_9BACT|nr:hypothetical protein Y981_04295 [Leptospirillum ferriphilum YSK]
MTDISGPFPRPRIPLFPESFLVTHLRHSKIAKPPSFHKQRKRLITGTCFRTSPGICNKAGTGQAPVFFLLARISKCPGVCLSCAKVRWKNEINRSIPSFGDAGSSVTEKTGSRMNPSRLIMIK